MGIFLIFAILLVMTILSIVFMCTASEEKAYTVEYNRDEHYLTKTRKLKSRFWRFWYNAQDGEIIVGICIAVFATVVIALSTISIVVAARRNVKYEQTYQQYIVLTERLEADNNNYHLFYEDICAYNNAILEDRYWADNLWVNWYNNGLIKDLPLIGE